MLRETARDHLCSRYAAVIAARARTTSRLTPRPSYKFLYFDPFGPDADKSQRLGGSILQYQGGMEGLNTFPDRCRYLGMFAEIPDPVRGPVLRQVADTQDPDGTFTGDQFLEVISGPMH